MDRRRARMQGLLLTPFALGVLLFAAPVAAQDAGSRPDRVVDGVHHWSEVAIDASGLDHTPPAPDENREFAEQLGPGRSARAMAIVHIAIFEALNAIDGRYQSYAGIPGVRIPASAK